MTNEEQSRLRKELDQKFQEARKVAKLTQQGVATAVGIHVNFYASMERGEENPSFEKL